MNQREHSTKIETSRTGDLRVQKSVQFLYQTFVHSPDQTIECGSPLSSPLCETPILYEARETPPEQFRMHLNKLGTRHFTRRFS